ncbi:MAG: Rrf2 family transcriptional regulator [Candidatus Omnitrophica bacterium]|nr:Rrf2 family transcriptional regulator [Candidatus Omnitrophota bacterium]
MKLITRNTDYSLRALIYMAKKGGIVSVRELERALKIPRAFLRKILQALNKKGILASQKGPGGGFRLLVAPKDLRLLDVASIFQGRVRLNECLFKRKACPDIRKCPLKRELDNIESYALRRLGAISLAALLK